MTDTLDLPADTMRLITEAAARKGQSPQSYLQQLVERDVAGGDATPDMLGQGLHWLTSRPDEEVQTARRRILAASPAPRDLPPEQTLLNVLEGAWPGTETDAEIRQALDRMS